MQEDMQKPIVEATAPAPAPQKATIRMPRVSLKAVAAYVLIALVAGTVGYALNRPAPYAPAPPEAPAAPGQPEPAPEASPAPPEGEPEMVKGEVILNVSWIMPHASLGPSFHTRMSEVDPSQPAPTSYQVIGRIPEGEYADYTLYRAAIPCESLCMSEPYYRLLWKADSTVVLLKRYSDADLTAIRSDVRVLEDARIPEFDFPKSLRTPQGVELALDEWRERDFELRGRKFAFRDANAGDVFADDYDETIEGAPLNGFYVPSPDGTFAVYKVPVPFMGEGDGVADITWADDGSKNTYDYRYTDINGCGSFNLASVVAPTAIDRAKDLIPVGKASNGDSVFGFRDPAHPVLKAVYDAYAQIPEGGVAKSYEEFLASKPVFIWIDSLGRFIKFQRTSYLPAVECGKPVIYLYPETTTDVSVKIEPQGGMRVSEPSYDGGWNVRATPEGALTDLRDGSSWPYLYWEGRGGLYETPRQGWVVKRENVPAFVRGTLAAYGLNEKEIADFAEFWLPRMTAKPWYFVTFLGTRDMDRLAPLDISPKPDTVFRILMDYRPLDAPIAAEAPSAPRPVRREGFTVIEWGGVLGRE